MNKMKTETMDPELKGVSVRKGLLMAPSTAGYTSLINKHKRAGSTGTTGDESYTTDEEDNIEPDEPDCSIKDHVTSKLFNHDHNDFGLMSDISTITDKVEHISVMHRNSSDSSVYSDLGLEKCVDEMGLDYVGKQEQDENVADLSVEKGASGDRVNSDRTPIEQNDLSCARLQQQLSVAHQELRLKDEEVNRLSRIRQDVESELEDLTASLFQVSLSTFLILFSKLLF